eukprot:COSAG01_NODE_27711_length_679_cov_0.662069_1_plen_164_part_01
MSIKFVDPRVRVQYQDELYGWENLYVRPAFDTFYANLEKIRQRNKDGEITDSQYNELHDEECTRFREQQRASLEDRSAKQRHVNRQAIRYDDLLQRTKRHTKNGINDSPEQLRLEEMHEAMAKKDWPRLNTLFRECPRNARWESALGHDDEFIAGQRGPTQQES